MVVNGSCNTVYALDPNNSVLRDCCVPANSKGSGESVLMYLFVDATNIVFICAGSFLFVSSIRVSLST